MEEAKCYAVTNCGDRYVKAVFVHLNDAMAFLKEEGGSIHPLTLAFDEAIEDDCFQVYEYLLQLFVNREEMFG